MEFRWNLFAFGMILFLALVVVTGFTVWVLRSLVGTEMSPEETMAVIVGVFSLMSAIVGFVGGYATGTMQALTAPSTPATMTEETALGILKEVVKK